jgi:cysteine desulfurase/selenocysteine lyase
MNVEARLGSLPKSAALSVRDQFPGIPAGWHYLDSAATAQKPQAVIDTITQAYARDYATVHRGVYERSASMTASYEAARAAAANLIGGQASELVFTRGATEAINLVARTLPRTAAPACWCRSWSISAISCRGSSPATKSTRSR